MGSPEDNAMRNTLDEAEEEFFGMTMVKVQMPNERKEIKIPVSSNTKLRKEVDVAFYNTPTKCLTLTLEGTTLQDSKTLEK